jgi:hypothetical protein
MSDIEGKAARAAASECGQRASFNLELRKRTALLHAFAVFDDQVDTLQEVDVT